LEGDRFPKQLGNLDRAIVGPFYFGATPSASDFFLCAHVDWAEASRRAANMSTSKSALHA
jgi:hypothetical protein